MLQFDVRSEAVVLLLFIHCFCSHCLWGLNVTFLFCIIRLGMRELIALCLLCSTCHLPVAVLRLLLVVPWVGLLYVILAFPGHTHLFYYSETGRPHGHVKADVARLLFLFDLILYIPVVNNCSVMLRQVSLG